VEADPSKHARDRMNAWRRDKVLLDFFTKIPSPDDPATALIIKARLVAFSPTEIVISDSDSEAILLRNEVVLIRAATELPEQR